ncbi:hypothetical protein ACF1BE_22820 [Streptomyces sp. NPDC014991]|uniref:hypothetical protein n=1 Tax=Streptomyces sp. NPDC014991 TaxID=3364935 RepID=UPI0036FE57AB
MAGPDDPGGRDGPGRPDISYEPFRPGRPRARSGAGGSGRRRGDAVGHGLRGDRPAAPRQGVRAAGRRPGGDPVGDDGPPPPDPLGRLGALAVVAPFRTPPGVLRVLGSPASHLRAHRPTGAVRTPRTLGAPGAVRVFRLVQAGRVPRAGAARCHGVRRDRAGPS